MQKLLKNEQGYTLILVMAAFVLITIISLPLIGQALSTASQVKITERNIQIDKLIDMGHIYFEKNAESAVASAQSLIDEESDPKSVLYNELVSSLPEFDAASERVVSEGILYQTGYTLIEELDNGYLITFKSEGTAEDIKDFEVRTLKVTLSGTETGTPGTPPDSEAPVEVDAGQCVGIGNDSTWLEFENNQYTQDKDCKLKGDFISNYPYSIVENHVRLIVEGSIRFKEEFNFNATHSKLKIIGEAVFEKDINVNKNQTVLILEGEGKIIGDINIEANDNSGNSAICIDESIKIDGSINFNGNNSKVYIIESKDNQVYQTNEPYRIQSSPSCPTDVPDITS